MSDAATFWRTHVAAWRRSDLTQSAYCREHGLCASQFSHWKRRLEPPQQHRGGSGSSSTPEGLSKPSFIEVTLAEAEEASAEATAAAEDEGQAAAAQGSGTERSRAAGLRLEIGDELALELERDFDAETLRRAVEVLRDARR